MDNQRGEKRNIKNKTFKNEVVIKNLDEVGIPKISDKGV